MNSKYLRNCRTYLAAAAIASFGALGVLAQPAGAAPLNPPLTANLIITKLADGPDTGSLPNNGQAQNVAGYRHLDGVGFTVKRIDNVDLNTEQGWKTADALSTAYQASLGGSTGSIATAEAFFASYDPDGTGPLPAGYHDLVSVIDGTHVTGELPGNGDDGVATFANLPIALYLVEETTTPSNLVGSAPFVVALPMTNAAGDGWLTDVYAYPKNKVKSVTKDVDDQGAYKIGDEVTWTITSPIPPQIDQGDTVTAYLVKDVLDAKLGYDPTHPASAVLTGAYAGPNLIADVDYQVEFDAGTNTVRVRFLAPGLEKLTANRDALVVVSIPTTVQDVGVIANAATVFDNDADADSETGGTATDDSEETRFGSLRIHKVNSADVGLQGATFEIYRTQADALAGTDPIAIDDGVNPPVSTWTTDASGYLTIKGLRYSNWVNGIDLTDPDGTLTPGDATDDMLSYWLVETAAPAGYSLISTPIRVNVTTVEGATGVDGDKSVLNVSSNGGWRLPLTGGAGSTLIYAAGLGLLGAAGAAALKRRRDDESSEA